MSRQTGNMENWYKHNHERERWGRQIVKAGLYPSEQTLIDRYFKPGLSLLNIGCGGGREAMALADRFELTAVDFSDEFCNCCKQNLQDHGLSARVLQMNALDLKFEDESFDLVMMVGQLIGHIPGRANRIQVLSEAARVLKPKGRALISTNAIELGIRYRAYFAAVNFIRQFYNPHNLEPDDALVFHVDGKRNLIGNIENRPVFHWYRTKTFLQDASVAGFTCLEFLRRYQFENPANVTDVSTSGESFYVLEKSS